MAKTNKPSNKKEKDTKSCSQYAILKALCSYNETPLPQIMLEKVCIDLMAWAELPSSLKLTQFMRGYGIPEQTYYYWVRKYAEFKQAHWYALTALGDRREIGAIEKRFDAGTIAITLSQYCSMNAAAEERRAKLRRDEQGSSFEDLTNCLTKLVEQKWGDHEADTGTTTQAPTVPTKTLPK